MRNRREGKGQDISLLLVSREREKERETAAGAQDQPLVYKHSHAFITTCAHSLVYIVLKSDESPQSHQTPPHQINVNTNSPLKQDHSERKSSIVG